MLTISDIISKILSRKLYFSSFLIAMIILIIVPYGLSDYLIYILIWCFIYIILASSYNLILGYTGQLSFCHAAFFGVGAYFSALTVIHFNLSFWIALPLSGIICMIFGVAVGFPVLKLRGAYFAVTTFFFGWVITLFIKNWSDLTGGVMGLRGIPSPDPILGIDFASDVSYYYLCLGTMVVSILFLFWVINTKLGSIFISIREEETLAESLGINTTKYKVLSFSMGAFFAGIAGSLFAHFFNYIHPESFSYAESIMVVLMTIVGGVGTILGPIIGASVITSLLEILRPIDPALRMMIWATALALTVIFEPEGLVGILRRSLKKFSGHL